MNPTRLTSVLVLVVGSAGLAMVAIGNGWPVALTGAILVYGSALVLSRHFWREGEKRSKRLSAAVVRSITSEISNLDRRMRDLIITNGRRVDSVSARLDAFTRGILEYEAQIELDIRDQTKTLRADMTSIREQLSALSSLSTKITDEQTRRIQKRFELIDQRATRRDRELLGELSGVVGVYEVLKPTRPYPPFGGWAIAGDCARRLVDLILTARPRWIAEAGSGLSTLLAAQTLELAGGEGMLISLEHDEAWREEAERLIDDHGVSHRCRIVHAPLVEVEINDERFMWYDVSRVDLPEEIDLLFIDGPPKASGDLARFPAVPLLYDRLSPGAVILMDDAHRPDEREAVSRWQSEYADLDVRWHGDTKGTVQLTKGSM